MISSATDHRSRATIHTDDPASRGCAPASRSVSVPNIRVAPTARARLRATAAAWRRRAVSLACPAHPPGRPPVPTGRLFQLAGIVLLGFVALISAAPVEAQSATTLVSNFDQGRDSDTFSAGVRAQTFKTGWNATGFTLHSIDVRVEVGEVILGNAGSRFAMYVCPVTAEGFPPVPPAEIPAHTACVALTPPSSFAAPATLTFTAPANTHLQRGTHYTVVNIATSGTPLYDATLSDGEDGGSAPPWAIGNGYVWYNSHPRIRSYWHTGSRLDYRGNVVVASGPNQALRIRINGATASRQVEAPTITGSPALSESGSDGTWTVGATVEVTLTFSEAVTVDTTGGTPSIGLDLGGTESRRATYLRGSGTTALVFGYTLTATDGSHTSLLVPVDSLALNGGTIRSQATSADAALGHAGAAKTGSGGLGTRSEGDPFTARFEGLPESHDGSSAFTGELHFSEAPEGLSYTTVAGGLLAVTGATVDKARRLTAGSNLAWEVTLTPSQSGDITITLPPRACSEANAVCAGTRALARAATATVRGVPFTASFSGVPAEHDGATAFDIRFHLSVEPANLSYRTVQNGLFDVTGGSIEKASRLVAGKNNGWAVRILPSGLGDVTVRVNGTTACDTAPGVCTADGRKLPGGLTVSTAGPAVLSVADAEVEEGADATLAFVVTLSKARSATTTVQYATSDGSATAGADYTAQSGTLTFGRLETSKTVSVPVLDDDHDEGSETLTLTLSNVSDNVRLGEATATGTITNSDPLPRALMARFGRTAAVHIVEHVEERMEAPREPGFRGRFAGRELGRGMERDFALGFLSQFGGAAGVNEPDAGAYGAMAGSPAGGTASLGMPGHAAGTSMAAVAGPMGAGPGLGGAGLMGGPSSLEGGPHGGGLLQMGLGGGDVLTGSAFSLNRETRQGGILSFWSRGARSHFSGRDGALSLGGDVRTTMFGADYAKGPLVTGLSLSHSRGLGEYAGVSGGQVASAVTGLYPWLGYRATDRISVWTVAGYGSGGLLLTPEGGPALESGLSMAMAAAGTRGELVAGGASGFELAFKADALWVGTSIDGVDGPAGRLKATGAAVTRFRTGLEGSRDYMLAGRLVLRPSVEVGLRHDGGDAETGAGMDVGSGLVVSDASTGLTVDVRGRMLVVHQAEGFRERGMALSLSYNPTPSTPLGFVARVAPSWGGQATSGAEALWGRETMAGMAHGDVADGTRLEAEVGYGLPVGSRFVGTPRVGVGTSETGRDYRLGYRLGALGGEGTTFELGVEAQRRESPLQAGTDHGVLARATLRW